MWLLAITYNHGNNDMEDHWSVHQTEQEARDELDEIMATDAPVFCWAVCQIKEGSEPHYSSDWKLTE